MAKIQMAKNVFTVIPEGDYVFKITKVDYDEVFGKLEVKMETKTGYTNTERYMLQDSNGEVNEGALVAFSYLAKTALNDFDVEEIDPEDIVGHFFKATVEHQKVPSKKDPSKTLTFIKLNDKSPASGFEGEEAVEGGIDLNALLG